MKKYNPISITLHSLPHKFGKEDRSMNSNEINLPKRNPQRENIQHIDHTDIHMSHLTSISTPTSQAVPVVLFTTTFARQHLLSFLTSFILSALANSTIAPISLPLLLSGNISWSILQNQTAESYHIIKTQYNKIPHNQNHFYTQLHIQNNDNNTQSNITLVPKPQQSLQ